MEIEQKGAPEHVASIWITYAPVNYNHVVLGMVGGKLRDQRLGGDRYHGNVMLYYVILLK